MTEVFVTQIRNPLAYTLPEVQAESEAPTKPEALAK